MNINKAKCWSLTWGTRTPCNATGWAESGWKTANQKGTWGNWWTVG